MFLKCLSSCDLNLSTEQEGIRLGNLLAARFVKSRYSRYSSVSDMLDVFGVDASFPNETGGSTYSSVLQNY